MFNTTAMSVSSTAECSGMHLVSNGMANTVPSASNSCNAFYSEKKSKPMYSSIASALARIIMGEPQKTFQAEGVTNQDGTLTCEGRDAFVNYLFSKKENQDAFKTEVIDVLIADREAQRAKNK